MDFINNITLNGYSILFLTIISFYSLKHQDNISITSKLYFSMVMVTILLLFLDIFSRFDGRPDTIYALFNYSGNFLVFLLSPLLPSLWLIYVHLQLFDDEMKTKKIILPLITLHVIHSLLVVFNLRFGWFYTIDFQNIYHRGPLFLYSAMPTILLLIIASMLVVLNRSKTTEKYYFSLLFFIVPPALSIVLQISFYGSSLILNSVVFSILVVFLNIQNKSIYTDHLTGVYNRNMLDKYLKNKIEKSTKRKTFSAIMLDLDDFKEINDRYGHDCGDQALKITVKILKDSIRSNDFIARFGGDEFWLVLNASTETDLLNFVNRININFKKFNTLNSSTYKLNVSMGYAIYNPNLKLQVAEFQKYLDEKMYHNKSKNH